MEKLTKEETLRRLRNLNDSYFRKTAEFQMRPYHGKQQLSDMEIQQLKFLSDIVQTLESAIEHLQDTR